MCTRENELIIYGTFCTPCLFGETQSTLYEIEGYDYFTISKVNKRIREKTYTGKFLDLKNGIR